MILTAPNYKYIVVDYFDKEYLATIDPLHCMVQSGATGSYSRLCVRIFLAEHDYNAPILRELYIPAIKFCESYNKEKVITDTCIEYLFDHFTI
jgi:hypothetical protein